jgi:transcription antitermination factor NusG
MPETVGWAAVMTRSQREDDVNETLLRLGYRTYLPHYKRRLAGVRVDPVSHRRIRTRGLGAIVERALFPGYLFVHLRPQLRVRPILVTPGVVRILRHPDEEAEPQLISDGIIDELRERVEAGDFDQVPRPGLGKPARRIDIKSGDRVRTVQGAVGELIDLDDGGRAQVLQRWFNADRIVQVQDARDLLIAVGG